MKKTIALFLCLCMTLGCMSFALAEGKFIPGTYEGTAFGFGGDIKATVTVDENAITAIELFGPDETPMLGGAALKTLEEAYIGKASATEVDTVVSATVSSRGAQDAIAAALKKALANPEEDAPAAEEVKEKVEYHFIPGTYQVKLRGMGGYMTIDVTFSEDRIEDFVVVKHTETQGIGTMAIEQVIPAMLEAQSPDVDSVTAATITSEALKEALRKAIEMAAAPVEEQTEDAAGAFVAGTYEGWAEGFAGDVKVTVTVDANAITAIEIVGADETPAIGGAAMTALQEAYIGKASADDVDSVSGATYTSKGVKEAVAKALAKAAETGDADAAANAPVEEAAANVFDAVSQGFGGDVKVSLTVEDGVIASIEIAGADETPAIGGAAMTAMQEAYVGKASADDVDLVSGATFTSKAVKDAVEKALAAALGATGENASAEPDVTAAEDYSVAPYLVWDPADPSASTGVNAAGETFDKLKSAQGCFAELNVILGWSEAPFDEAYYTDHEFVAGDVAELSRHGVHAEYLPILQALKAEIREYFVWAAPILASGESEDQLTLFSTPNLKIFQTYCGSLRQSEDKSQWSYDDVDQVKQLVLDSLAK